MSDIPLLNEIEAAIGGALGDLLTQLDIDPDDYPSDDGHHHPSYGAILYRAAAEAVLPIVAKAQAQALRQAAEDGWPSIPAIYESQVYEAVIATAARYENGTSGFALEGWYDCRPTAKRLLGIHEDRRHTQARDQSSGTPDLFWVGQPGVGHLGPEADRQVRRLVSQRPEDFGPLSYISVVPHPVDAVIADALCQKAAVTDTDVRHFVTHNGATRSLCDETVSCSAWSETGSLTDTRFTTERDETTCPECQQEIRAIYGSRSGAPEVWQVVDATDSEWEQQIATFADEASAYRLEERVRAVDPHVYVTVRRHDIVADPESVEIIRYASFSGLADCDDPVEPWETTLIEGRNSVEQISKERRYTTELVVEESDLDEWWLDRIGTAHYIKVSGPDVEQVRAAWIAAREAYLASKGALGAGEEAGPHA